MFLKSEPSAVYHVDNRRWFTLAKGFRRFLVWACGVVGHRTPSFNFRAHYSLFLPTVAHQCKRKLRSANERCLEGLRMVRERVREGLQGCNDLRFSEVAATLNIQMSVASFPLF
jgi:hypothetical protein